MKETVKQRGFVTIATGDEKYYTLAANLLKSYRMHSCDEVPFAIICDRRNSLTEDFDHVVVMENVHASYLDKLHLYENSPYEETIFVDADALFLADPALLWEDFAEECDFSCYGRPVPLDSKEGWFEYQSTGEFQKFIRFGVSMHGGLYYFRKTEAAREVFQRAIQIAENYSDFKFAHFDKPADEPVLALSMAVSGFAPCQKKARITFLVSYEGRLQVQFDGQLMMDKEPYHTVILHFATMNVNRFLYQYLKYQMDHQGKACSKFDYWKLKAKYLFQDIKIPLMRRIKRFVKYSVSPKLYNTLKKRLKR